MSDRRWWLDSYELRWEPLPQGKIARVRPEKQRVVFDVSLPTDVDRLPSPLLDAVDAQIAAGIAGEPDVAGCTSRFRIVQGGAGDETSHAMPGAG